MTDYAISEKVILVTSELQDRRIMPSNLIINSGAVVLIRAMGGGWAVWVVALCVWRVRWEGLLKLSDVYRLTI